MKFNFKWLKDMSFKSIFIRNFLLIIITIAVPISAINVLYYAHSQSVLLNETRTESRNKIIKIKSKFELMYNNCNNVIASLYNNESVNVLMNEKDLFTSTRRNLENNKKLNSVMHENLLSREYYDSIEIYSKTQNYVKSTRNSNYLTERNFPELYNILINADNQSKDNLKIKTITHNNIMSFVQPVYVGDVFKGCLIVKVNLNKIYDDFNDTNKHNNYNVLVYDENDNYIYSNNENLVNRKLSDFLASEKLPPFEELVEFKSSDDYGRKLGMAVKSNTNGWSVVLENYIALYTENTTLVYILMIVISILLIFFISFIISKQIYIPIKRLLRVIEEDNSYVNCINPESKKYTEEFNFISKNIKKDIQSESEKNAEFVDKMLLLKKYHLIALQEQIKPHFLFNTIQVIGLYAQELTDSTNKVTDMLKQLSILLKLSFNNKYFLVSIRDEIEHADAYIKLQEARYKNLFNVKWIYDEDVLNYKTPKIILQPIIENMIYHGIKPARRTCNIIVEIRKTSDEIEFHISDDGVGITAERLLEIGDTLNKEDKFEEDGHVGLKNVNNRIKIIFGNKYGIKVNSDGKCGTEVIVNIPYYEENLDNN